MSTTTKVDQITVLRTEQRIYHSTSHEGAWSMALPSGGYVHFPAESRLHVTNLDRFWVRYDDGTEGHFDIGADRLPASPGHRLALVINEGEVAAACNLTTRKKAYFLKRMEAIEQDSSMGAAIGFIVGIILAVIVVAAANAEVNRVIGMTKSSGYLFLAAGLFLAPTLVGLVARANIVANGQARWTAVNAAIKGLARTSSI